MQWISVDDRLPEENNNVLVHRGTYIDMAYQKGRIWCRTTDDWWLDDVTHWMPLPEPPKEADKE